MKHSKGGWSKGNSETIQSQCSERYFDHCCSSEVEYFYQASLNCQNQNRQYPNQGRNRYSRFDPLAPDSTVLLHDATGS